MEHIFQYEYAGIPIRYAYRNRGTPRLFGFGLRYCKSAKWDICASQEEIRFIKDNLPKDSTDAYAEYRCLLELTAKHLLMYNCCIFHAVSFTYRNYAWLIAAPSGTGKTTQYMNWQRMFPSELTMISGDMPVLKLETDGSISVHPSPWNGKENIRNSISAPLKGVVFLEQGNANRLKRFPPDQALLPIFNQFMVLPDTEMEILNLMKIFDRLLCGYSPVRFVNRGDDASTVLLREWIGGSYDKI